MLTDKFFNHIRQHLGGGSLSESAVKGINVIARVWLEEGGVLKDAHLAYVLGSCWHEVQQFKLSHEIGRGKGKKYGLPANNGFVYYGRGFIQLTWDFNYKTMGQRTGLPLYDNPDLATDFNNAAKIAVIGMKEGLFTGKKMSDFFTFREMRRVVNGMDKADLIAGYAFVFQAALALNDAGLVISEGEKPLTSSKTIGTTVAGGVTSIGATVALVNEVKRVSTEAIDIAKGAAGAASDAGAIAKQALENAGYNTIVIYGLVISQVVMLGYFGFIAYERYKKPDIKKLGEGGV